MGVMPNYFNWNICLPTTCYFTSILLPHAIQPSDHHNSGPILSFIKAQAYFQEYVEFFLKVSLTNVNFIDTLPSILAASVIAAARRAFGLSPTWSDKLEILTGYREDLNSSNVTDSPFEICFGIGLDKSVNRSYTPFGSFGVSC